MKFHRSNMKTERQVCESLQSGPKRKKLQVVQPKSGLKSTKIELDHVGSEATIFKLSQTPPSVLMLER